MNEKFYRLFFITTCIIYTAINIHAQNYPQVEQNSLYYSNSGSFENSIMEALIIHQELEYDDSIGHMLLTPKARIDKIYRLYEIGQTNFIYYMTINGPIQTDDASTRMDFGSELTYHSTSDEDNFFLAFSNPVTRIDPHIFTSDLLWIVLPSSKGLIYVSSPDINVAHLSSIKGLDVVDDQSLVSSDSTLIVAATYNFLSSTAYYIPEQVRIIGDGALNGSLVPFVVSQGALKHIGHKALNCPSAEAFYFLSATVPTIEDDSFGNRDPKSFKIYVPKKLQKKYKKAWPALKKSIKSIPRNDEVVNILYSNY